MNSTEQNPITTHTVNDLVTALSEGERTTFLDIIQSLNIPVAAFDHMCSWSEESYTRNCIVENDQFELILLCWEKGQITPIHDHGGEECWVKVIQGEFKETRYQQTEDGKLNPYQSSISKTGDISYMVDFMGFHSLENMGNQRSMSLHLYAKPIRNCRLFDENSGQFVRKELVYNTVSELMVNNK